MTFLDPAQRGRPASLLAAAFLFAAAEPAPAPAQTALKFTLDGRLEGPAAFFLVPQDKGFFSNAGLDVSVDEGTTPLEPITRVASGAYDVGLADINVFIRWRDQNPTAPVKAVFMVYNRPPYAIVARKSRGITEPKQLEGKKLGAPPTSTSAGEWPLFAKLNQIDASKVTIESVGAPVRVPMLAAGQLDAVLGYGYRVYVDIRERGVPPDDIVLMRMADYGLKLYGSTIIVNSKLATEKSQAVQGFVHAILKGLRETVHNPATALDSVLRRDDLANRTVELERLRMAIRDNIVTPEVRARG